MLVEFVKGAKNPVIKSSDNWKTMKSIYMKILFSFFKESLFIYLFGCPGSWLWHMGSLLCHADLSLQVRTLSLWHADFSSCGPWAL